MRNFILVVAGLTLAAGPAHAQRATAHPIARPVADAHASAPVPAGAASASPTGPQAAAAPPPQSPPR